jgi:hypothetical protein
MIQCQSLRKVCGLTFWRAHMYLGLMFQLLGMNLGPGCSLPISLVTHVCLNFWSVEGTQFTRMKSVKCRTLYTCMH